MTVDEVKARLFRRFEQAGLVVTVCVDEAGCQHQAAGVHDRIARRRFEIPHG